MVYYRRKVVFFFFCLTSKMKSAVSTVPGDWAENLIGLYTSINYFGRYATNSHKDGGRSHIQSRETIGQEDHVTCLKLRRRVNLSPAFGATYKTRIFYEYAVFKHPCSLLPNFFAAATRSFTKRVFEDDIFIENNFRFAHD